MNCKGNDTKYRLGRAGQNEPLFCAAHQRFPHKQWMYLHGPQHYWISLMTDTLARLTQMLNRAAYFWWSNITREILEKVQKCDICRKHGKNDKTIIPKNKTVPLPQLSEPNSEIQIVFPSLINLNSSKTPVYLF